MMNQDLITAVRREDLIFCESILVNKFFNHYLHFFAVPQEKVNHSTCIKIVVVRNDDVTYSEFPFEFKSMDVTYRSTMIYEPVKNENIMKWIRIVPFAALAAVRLLNPPYNPKDIQN